MSLVRGAIGDVHARDSVEVQPVTGKRQLWTVAGLEAEHVAVERLRSLEVVGEHEDVPEPVEGHQLAGSRVFA